MPTLAIEDFRHGLDVRKSALTGAPGSCQILDDCVLTQGGEVAKRMAFVQIATLPDQCALGLLGHKGTAYAFYPATLTLKLPRFDGHPTRFRERCCHAENPSTVFTGVPSPDR